MSRLKRLGLFAQGTDTPGARRLLRRALLGGLIVSSLPGCRGGASSIVSTDPVGSQELVARSGSSPAARISTDKVYKYSVGEHFRSEKSFDEEEQQDETVAASKADRVSPVSHREVAQAEEPFFPEIERVAGEVIPSAPFDPESEPLAAEPSPFQANRPVVEVTFNQVMYSAIHHHPKLASGLAAISQTRGDYLQSTLLPNPELFTDAQLLPLTRPFTETKQGGPSQADVILTYPIDWFVFGKRTAAMHEAHLSIHVSQAEYENLVRERILSVSNAFYAALEADALSEIAQQNVQNLEQLEQITSKAVEEGGRARVDLNRVRLDLLSARQIQRTAQAASRSAAAELRAVSGQSVHGAELKAVGELSMPLRGGPMDPESAYSQAQLSRPDMNALRWKVQQAAAKVEVQELAAKPTLAPALGYTRQFQKPIGFQDANSWSASLTMSVPIFDRNQGNIDKASAYQRQLQWDYQALCLDVRAEVEQAVAELEAAFENASTVADEQLTLANTVQKSIAEAYQGGERSLIDVLDAQRNYRETHRLYVSSRALYWRALYRYYAVIGQQQTN